MKHFWQGFEKAAKENQDFTPGQAAVGAGAAATGMGAIRTHRQISKTHAREKAIAKSRSFRDFISKLEPGDIIYSRSKGKRTRGIDLHDVMQAGSGSHHVHSQLYQGKGNILDIGGPGLKVEGGKAERFLGVDNDLVAYRSQGSKAQRQKAVARANKLRGANYTNEAGFVSRGSQALLGAPGKACKIKPGGGVICNDIPLKAHADKFKKHHQTIADMKANKHMKPVAKLQKFTPGVRDTIMARGVYPILRNAKWGLGAGAAALIGKKILDAKKRRGNNPSA